MNRLLENFKNVHFREYYQFWENKHLQPLFNACHQVQFQNLMNRFTEEFIIKRFHNEFIISITKFSLKTQNSHFKQHFDACYLV